MATGKTSAEKTGMDFKFDLKKANSLLTIIVVVLGLFITLMPFLPNVSLWLSQTFDSTGGVRYQGTLANTVSDLEEENLAPAPDTNRLVIPVMHLDEEIVVGDSPYNVHKGVWHRPNSSYPNLGSNTVLVGHRFSYSDPAVFYHLDKMKVGDSFAIWWDGQEYVYQVTETKAVGPYAVEIEAPTNDSRVTLYTCTPLWSLIRVIESVTPSLKADEEPSEMPVLVQPARGVEIPTEGSSDSCPATVSASPAPSLHPGGVPLGSLKS